MSFGGTVTASEETDKVARLVSAKLAAFLKTLRDAGFAVGLQEGRDAAALMAAGYAETSPLLRSAFRHLFSARKSDWDRFDGLFDAFWLGKRARSRSRTLGSARSANSPSLKDLPDTKSSPAAGQTANDGMAPRPSRRRRTIISGKRIGSTSQATKSAQARRDSKT